MTTLTQRQLTITSALLDAIKTEPTDYQLAMDAVRQLGLIKDGGWMEVRNLLQVLMDEGKVARGPFDPRGPETYVRLI